MAFALNTFPAAPLPEFPESIVPRYTTKESQFGDGYKQIAVDGINARADEVPLVWNNIMTSEMIVLRNFLEAHAPNLPFYYTPIDGQMRAFICREWTMERVDAGFYNMTARLEQYHGV